ncbi:relaxase/mobilization nuclease domain-containing protein [Halomonas sp. TBZ9]|uniref:Relaxase/mobilization nuclease domain-containing protein n=1 Tax=Vreelandella azerica TaxID=2732867 RepID=A0A7Y3XAJ7_9GAMM|nr:relaxase/mobilization nuclease domain-containing protein [Halomonas azerica]NOG32847.1 relaxase/mobilization nuclease domain-containing protein [Halomonas azerica]
MRERRCHAHQIPESCQGSAAGAVRYLLQENDHNDEVRAEVTVLRGDPSIVAQVADATTHQWRYTSGIISWAPDDNPTPAEIQAVIEDWEATAFAGLDADQYASCAVLHRDDDGTPHVHTLTARVELKTGKALNIAPPSHQKTFDPLRDYWNHKMGWARPDDPDRARSVQPGHESKGRSKPDKHPRSRKEITEHIETLAAEGLVTTAAEVRQELSEIGEITRASHAYVSVKPPAQRKPFA